jgi:glycosyltransferase involved in cell wall biosynthesis
MQPFFSIIIPTFNAAQTIAIALESVLQQTFQDYEVILVDGQSTDATLEVVKSYKSDRVTWISELDKGVYDAMNKGIQHAKGKWLYFLGSDDYLLSNAVLKKVQDRLQTVKNKVAYGNVLINGNTGWAINGQVYNGKFSFQKLLKSNICHQSIFYNTSFIKKHQLQYDLKYPISADWDFNIACRTRTKFTYMHIVIAVFNAGGISSETTPEKEPFLLERKIKYAHLYKKYKPSLLQRFFKKLERMKGKG